MTPRQVALHLMGQTGTTVGHPDFIVGYLEAELARDPQAFHTQAQRDREAIMAALEGLQRQARVVAHAYAQVGRAMIHAGEAIARANQTTTQNQYGLQA